MPVTTASGKLTSGMGVAVGVGWGVGVAAAPGVVGTRLGLAFTHPTSNVTAATAATRPGP